MLYASSGQWVADSFGDVTTGSLDPGRERVPELCRACPGPVNSCQVTAARLLSLTLSLSLSYNNHLRYDFNSKTPSFFSLFPSPSRSLFLSPSLDCRVRYGPGGGDPLEKYACSTISRISFPLATGPRGCEIAGHLPLENGRTWNWVQLRWTEREPSRILALLGPFPLSHRLIPRAILYAVHQNSICSPV